MDAECLRKFACLVHFDVVVPDEGAPDVELGMVGQSENVLIAWRTGGSAGTSTA
jgi:hypothetical protein